MSSRASIQQFVSNYEPAGTAIGDEWNNPLTGKLYKRTLLSGLVSWADITPLQPSTLFVGTTGNISVGSSTDQGYKLSVNGSFAATTKSFVIDHPIKSHMFLRYGSLESPYHGVRLTGTGVLINGTCTIQLPDYIHGLCKQEDSQVQVTNIKHGKVIWVEDINVDQDKFTVMADILVHDENEYHFYWSFTAIRKDIEPMIVEF